MDILVNTYGQPILTECVHMTCAPLPVPVAAMVRARLGEPYASNPTTARWSGSFITPTLGAPQVFAFELVICQRGASIRCHWDHADAIAHIIAAMVPEITAIVMPMPMR